MPRALPIVLLVLLASAAAAYEGEVRRTPQDAGVHVPTLTKPPELLHFVEAPYPEGAADAGVGADVALQVTIAADGTVAEAKVARSAGPEFDEAALAAVRQFRFSPAEVDGAPAAVQIEYVYRFAVRTVEPVAAPPAPAILEGQLLSRGSRGRVAGATVRCGEAAEAAEATSDAEGRFRLELVPGTCAVRVMAPGHHPYRTQETLQSGERLVVAYYLMPRAGDFETVVRSDRDKKEVVQRTLTRSELQKVPGTFGDPIRVLQNMPGVARMPYSLGQLIVRGANPNETRTFLDGVEVPLLFHLGGGPSVVNAEFLERIDFFPGGFGSRYGRAIGGAVDVATRKGAQDTWHGVVKVDLLDTGVFVEAPVANGVSVAAAARRSYVDALLPLVLPNDPSTGTLLVVPRYWDYQLRADAGPRDEAVAPGSPSNTYSVMAFGSDDILRVVASGSGLNQDLRLDVHTNFHRLKGDWTHRRGDLSSSLLPYVGYDLRNLTFGGTRLRADVYTLGLREELRYQASPTLTLRGGLDVLFEHLVGTAELPVLAGEQYVAFPGAEPKTQLQSVRRVINSTDAAVFAEADFTAGPVTVTPGLRLSRSRIYGQNFVGVEPRLWTRLALGERAAVKASAGLYLQPPEAADLEPAPLGNVNLGHEKALQISVGAERRFGPAITADVTAYYSRRFDLIVYPGDTVRNPDGSVMREGAGNVGLGRAYGVEVLVRHEVTKDFFGWIAYTLNRSEAKRRDQDDYRLTMFDQTHILTAVGSYRLPHDFEVGVRFRYVTGRPETPTLHPHDLYGVDANRYFGTPGERLSSRLSAFNQLDVRIAKSFLFKSWTLTTYLDVQNVYNATNVEATLFDYRFRERFDVPGIPLLPVLGASGSF